MPKNWNAARVERFLMNVFDKYMRNKLGGGNVYTFGEHLVTRDNGVVIQMPDRSEFQITIVQTKQGTA